MGKRKDATKNQFPVGKVGHRILWLDRYLFLSDDFPTLYFSPEFVGTKRSIFASCKAHTSCALEAGGELCVRNMQTIDSKHIRGKREQRRKSTSIFISSRFSVSGFEKCREAIWSIPSL